MSKPIENYALLSDCQRAALVDREGSIDWLCLPRFDSPACFAALLGNESNGYWKICPEQSFSTERRYRDRSLVLETDFIGAGGKVRLTDFLVLNESLPLLLRKVSGLQGRLKMRCDLSLRFDYGSIVPWSRKTPYGLHVVAGPDEVHVESPIRLERGKDLGYSANFEVAKGDTLWFSMKWDPDFHGRYHKVTNPEELLKKTDDFWRTYAEQCTYDGIYADAVIRSVLTLKALVYEPTGGLVAAPTTSLPETLGGERNWDYRYAWIRDSTFAMYAFLTAGYRKEAQRWQQWLLRSLAGTPASVNIMYGISGERRLTEVELSWLEGYENSKPVRIGNAAYKQLQLDVFGEAMDTLHLALKNDLPIDENSWRIQECFIDFLNHHWNEPDEGIWEVRGPRQHFTHSKIMSWVAVDRAIRSAERGHLKAPVEEWKKLRDRIHADICAHGFDTQINSFTQAYESKNLDASLLMIPIVGFLPPEDPRVIGTVAAIEKELFKDGFVLRYKTEEMKDILHGREGNFLACTFWLVDCWILMGRFADAEKLFRRLLSLGNDLLLFSEEYDGERDRLVGNFPQALTHIALINTAFNLHRHRGPAKDRSQSS